MSMAITIRETRYLLCHKCNEYLSCGPVMIMKSNGIICGRCYKGEDKAFRNFSYEKVAKNIQFPCKYRSLGCEETFVFAENYQYSHEYSCDFRTYKCLFWHAGEPDCLWENLSSKMLGHCLTTHPDKVLSNCCYINIDVNTSNNRNYLLIAFAMVFIVNIKVTLEKDTIEMHIHFIGKQRGAGEFQYILNMRKDHILLTKLGNCKTLSGPMKISDLKDLFQGLDGVTFQLTLFTFCATCRKEQTFGKLNSKGSYWQCAKCTPCIKDCEYIKQFCTFKDYPSKVAKHEEYFCKFSTGLDGINIIPYGKIWIIKKRDDKCAFMSDIGLVICEFTATRTEGLEFFFYSPLKSCQEADFFCQVNIFSSVAPLPKVCTPKFQKYNYFDWYLAFRKNDYPIEASEIAIELIIRRNEQINIEDYSYLS